MMDAGVLANIMYNPQGMTAGRTAARTTNDAKADAAAKDFESLFLAQMLESMFGESLGDDLFGDAETNEVYKGLMMEEYGRQIANAGGIGIADYLKRELLKAQEI
jgi:peptidoglycan hydrolase FlgJ